MLGLKSFTSEDRSIVPVHRNTHSYLSLSFRTWVYHPPTRIDVRLLGPCYKTGRATPYRQLQWINRIEILPNGLIHHASFVSTQYKVQTVTSEPESSPHLSILGPELEQSKLTSREERTSGAKNNKKLSGLTTLNNCWILKSKEFLPSRLVWLASLCALSSTLSLSFQSYFHLSHTVLVRYRSLSII